VKPKDLVECALNTIAANKVECWMVFTKSGITVASATFTKAGRGYSVVKSGADDCVSLIAQFRAEQVVDIKMSTTWKPEITIDR